MQNYETIRQKKKTLNPNGVNYSFTAMDIKRLVFYAIAFGLGYMNGMGVWVRYLET